MDSYPGSSLNRGKIKYVLYRDEVVNTTYINVLVI